MAGYECVEACSTPHKNKPHGGSPFGSLVPSSFPPKTNRNVVTSFQMVDQDGSGFVDDMELQKALSSCRHNFNLRTVHLLMYHFTGTNTRVIGPMEFVSLYSGLQTWRALFDKFDRDRSGKLDPSELREALQSLGFPQSPIIVELLVFKFDKSQSKKKAIEYDNFIDLAYLTSGIDSLYLFRTHLIKATKAQAMERGEASSTQEIILTTLLRQEQDIKEIKSLLQDMAAALDKLRVAQGQTQTHPPTSDPVAQPQKSPSHPPLKPKKERAPLKPPTPLPLGQLLTTLVERKLIPLRSPIPLLPLTKRNHNYQENEHCAFRQGPGHSTDRCMTLKRAVEDIINEGKLD
ncbi:hypothetical protein HHK36_017254 [Tetracentron sinense]|uniref:EF-hand domain-containing protein n=1 Tax=Tetracentron sinense TaxID=13715 RepID=A0A835DF09_TETSI|nr:hypothetical protein HHK36_017254 [Tetracentron sinense]